MPIRMLFQHIQERRRLGYENDAQQVGSQSQAQSNALTNSISVAGIPITNTVSGSRASSTSGSRSGSLNEQFNLGGLGFNAGVDSQKIGTGIGINRTPGHLGFHLGALNVDLSNNGGLLGKNQNTQTQTAATSMATGEGATSTSTSNTYSRGFDLGHLFGIQNTFSRSQAKSTSLNGQTSATAAANAAQQNANTFQPYYQYEQQPGVRNLGNIQTFDYFHSFILQQTPFPFDYSYNFLATDLNFYIKIDLSSVSFFVSFSIYAIILPLNSSNLPLKFLSTIFAIILFAKTLSVLMSVFNSIQHISNL